MIFRCLHLTVIGSEWLGHLGMATLHCELFYMKDSQRWLRIKIHRALKSPKAQARPQIRAFERWIWAAVFLKALHFQYAGKTEKPCSTPVFPDLYWLNFLHMKYTLHYPLAPGHNIDTLENIYVNQKHICHQFVMTLHRNNPKLSLTDPCSAENIKIH